MTRGSRLIWYNPKSIEFAAEKYIVSEELLQAGKELKNNILVYTPVIEARLQESGFQLDRVLVMVAAMYFPALEKLARE